LRSRGQQGTSRGSAVVPPPNIGTRIDKNLLKYHYDMSII
jgi:hypothetical protein